MYVLKPQRDEETASVPCRSPPLSHQPRCACGCERSLPRPIRFFRVPTFPDTVLPSLSIPTFFFTVYNSTCVFSLLSAFDKPYAVFCIYGCNLFCWNVDTYIEVFPLAVCDLFVYRWIRPACRRPVDRATNRENECGWNAWRSTSRNCNSGGNRQPSTLSQICS